MKPVVLVAASMDKVAGGTRRGWLRSFPELDDKRHQTIEALQSYLRRPRNHADRLLGKAGLAEALAKNMAVLDGPTMPALERYVGGPFPALARAAGSPDVARQLNEQVVAISALWGLVRLDDHIPDYHLHINQQLPPLRRLSTWWRDDLNAALTPLTANQVVWDFLPLFYRRAWTGDRARVPDPFDKRPPTRPKRVITVKMQTSAGRAIRNDAPDARGEVAAFVIERGLTGIDGLDELAHSQGFAFVPTASLDGTASANAIVSTAVFRKKH